MRATSKFVIRNLGVPAGALAVTATLGCPIQRPSIPPEYYEFRLVLQGAVTDTALVEMEGLPGMQAHLRGRLADLAAIVTVDSLLAAMDADPELSPLGGALATTMRITLESDEVTGSMRSAFREPSGQRQAVDAIVIGLGRALHLLSPSDDGAGWAKRRRDALGMMNIRTIEH